jgi:2-polyprenyl-3-methyl-5-hydroxy-6-metoxy-1,4-benzoquinol methylase
MKHDAYYRHARADVVALIPGGTRHLLEIGCGTGNTGALAKARMGVNEAVGVELSSAAAAEAESVLDRVVCCDVEATALNFPESYFDCVICADVLEHLKDPWAVLRKLRPIISDDGCVVASIPNLQHLKPVLKILLDRFEYEEAGLLDSTHLRFFTLSTIKSLFSETGYRIERVVPVRSRKMLLLTILSLGILRKFTIFQYLVVARKN